MTIEESLAAREIVKMQAAGYQKIAAEMAAARLVVSQGFGKDHAAKVASKMLELVWM